MSSKNGKILPICGVSNDELNNSPHSVERLDYQWVTNCKGCERNRSGPNLKYYTGIRLKGLSDDMKYLSGYRSPGRDLNLWPPENETEVLATRVWYKSSSRNKPISRPLRTTPYCQLNALSLTNGDVLPLSSVDPVYSYLKQNRNKCQADVQTNVQYSQNGNIF